MLDLDCFYSVSLPDLLRTLNTENQLNNDTLNIRSDQAKVFKQKGEKKWIYKQALRNSNF